MALFLTRKQWFGAFVTGSVLMLLAWSSSAFISPWIPVVVGLLGATVVHMGYSGAHLIPFPHIMLCVAALQYILAPWVAYYYPPEDPLYDIADQLPAYLSYAGPLVLAMAVAWAVCLARAPAASAGAPRASAALLTEYDFMAIIGLIALVLARIIVVPGFAFVIVLLSQLRYIGVFGRMLGGGGGWAWRLAVIFVADIVLASGDSMFHGLVLWALWSFAFWIYCCRPSLMIIAPLTLLALVALPALQHAKWEMRGQSAFSDSPELAVIEPESDSRIDMAASWVTVLSTGLQRTLQLDFDAAFIADATVRYNQGWIVNRVMQVVPDIEPYARGATIKEALRAALLPRFIAPDKVTAGGRERMERFAGVILDERTSMNLGLAGEMYANFGHWGGILGCALYVIFFGLFLRFVQKRAARNPAWWCLLPFIAHEALKAEDGIAEILNWAIKAGLIFLALVMVFPAFRAALISTPNDLDTVPKDREILSPSKVAS